jgi:uncharacterized membrane protein YeiB
VSSKERAIAPDLARGAMLLFIALANSSGYAAAATAANATIQALERAVNVVLLTFVHARAYPVFAIMFGYSLVQLARRQEAAGASRSDVRYLLLRRNVWLIVFGFFHAALLYFADFLAAYGIIGILATFLLLYRERVQRVVLWLWGVSLLELIGLVGYLAYQWPRRGAETTGAATNAADSSSATDYISSIATRLNEWPMHTATVIPAIFVVCLGMWAANRRLLEDLQQHRRLLRTIALVCLPIAFVCAVPLALADGKIVHVDADTYFVMNLLHKVSGMFGGPGYVAAIGLIAADVPEPSGWIGRIGPTFPLRLFVSILRLADVAGSVHVVSRPTIRRPTDDGRSDRNRGVDVQRVRRKRDGATGLSRPGGNTSSPTDLSSADPWHSTVVAILNQAVGSRRRPNIIIPKAHAASKPSVPGSGTL